MNRRGFIVSSVVVGIVAVTGIVIVVTAFGGGTEQVSIQLLVQEIISATNTHRNLQTLLGERVWFVRGAGLIAGVAIGSLLGGVGSFLHYRRKLKT